jgi:hypothetical protein
LRSDPLAIGADHRKVDLARLHRADTLAAVGFGRDPVIDRLDPLSGFGFQPAISSLPFVSQVVYRTPVKVGRFG